MPDSLKGFEAEPPRDLAGTLRVMESRIDGLVADPEQVRWDIDTSSGLVYASRFLTYPRSMVGREKLEVAMAPCPGTDLRGNWFAIRDRFESLQWPGGIEITADDVIHSVFSGVRKRSLPEAADRLLTNLEDAKPYDHNTHDVVGGLRRGLFRMRSE